MKFKFLRATLVLGFAGIMTALSISSVAADAASSGGEAIPFVEENWILIGGAEIVEHEGENALRLGIKQEGAPFGFGTAVLKRAPFTNGIIEYDVFFGQTRTFAGVNFRVQDAGNFETFYLRAHQSGNPDANQYMPSYNGVQSWQLYYGEQYSAPTRYSFNEWMHVKLVVSGDLADVYIGNMDSPAITVELKRDEQTGGLGLWVLDLEGPAWFANFSVTPMDDVEIVGTPVPQQPAAPGTVMSWEVSAPFDGNLIKGVDGLPQDLIESLSFKSLEADQTGMTNLAKLAGVEAGADTVFVKLAINSQTDQLSEFQFGFSDEVTIYLNGQPLFKGNDGERTRDYRFLGTVGFYDSVFLPLKQGDNELVIAVSESVSLFNGWAVQGRFKDFSGLSY